MLWTRFAVLTMIMSNLYKFEHLTSIGEFYILYNVEKGLSVHSKRDLDFWSCKLNGTLSPYTSNWMTTVPRHSLSTSVARLQSVVRLSLWRPRECIGPFQLPRISKLFTKYNHPFTTVLVSILLTMLEKTDTLRHTNSRTSRDGGYKNWLS